MDEGVLILRLFLAVLIAGHGVQKLFGWFGGGGVRGTAPLFAGWGLQPAGLMVAVAGALELVGALLIATGTATILGVSIVFGTMLVAASVSWSKGLWAAKGGYELPLFYGLVALVLGVTGPGRLSVDHVLGLAGYSGILLAVSAAAVGAIGASPLLVRITKTLRKPA